jgi:hypothetical protein
MNNHHLLLETPSSNLSQIMRHIIGGHFNIGESAVSQARGRISVKIKQDKKLKKQIKRVENKLNLSNV